MRAYDLNNRDDRNTVLFSYFVNPKFDLGERIHLHGLLLESGYFAEFRQLYADGNFLTPDYLLSHTSFPYPFDSELVITGKDAELFYISELRYRKKQNMSIELMKILSSNLENKTLESLQGEIVKTVDSIRNVRKLEVDIDGHAEYDRRKNEPLGILTGIGPLDESCKGLGPGTMTCIFGYVGSLKTTLGINMAYHALLNNFNVLFITLEVPKKFMYLQILSIHSYYQAEYLGGNQITYFDLLKGELTPEQEDFMWNKVEPDFKKNVPGKIVFASQEDVQDFTYPGLVNLCSSFDFKIEVVMVDYFQLLTPYLEDKNEYLGAIRLSRDFARLAVGSSVSPARTVILLSQVNTKGFEEAEKLGGEYTLRAIAETPGLARDAYYVISLYVDDKLRASHEAKICLLKNKSGPIFNTPLVVPVDSRYMVMGHNIKGFSEPVKTDQVRSVFSSGATVSVGAPLPFDLKQYIPK